MMKSPPLGLSFVRVLLAAASAAIAVGCYDSGFGEPSHNELEIITSETLAGLHERFVEMPAVVEGNITVSGIVSSSDRAGNFYRSICIEEDRSAVEIMAGLDGLHNDYPPGCRVTIRLKGLTLAKNRGVLQIGTEPEPGSGFETDYIGSRAALDRVLVRNAETLHPIQPAILAIPELTPERCGTLVRIDHLRLQPDSSDIAVPVWNGYRLFVDKAGNEIFSYVRPYASFAQEEIPRGEVSLVGILQHDDSGEGRFLLKLRDENDCLQMD